jgi:hypothetical protein
LAVWSGEKINANGCFRLRIYSPTNKTLIHDSLYVFGKWGTNFSHNKIRYNYSREMFTRREKPIRIIGDPDNQHPDKWSSTIFLSAEKVWIAQHINFSRSDPHWW